LVVAVEDVGHLVVDSGEIGPFAGVDTITSVEAIGCVSIFQANTTGVGLCSIIAIAVRMATVDLDLFNF